MQFATLRIDFRLTATGYAVRSTRNSKGVPS